MERIAGILPETVERLFRRTKEFRSVFARYDKLHGIYPRVVYFVRCLAKKVSVNEKAIQADGRNFLLVYYIVMLDSAEDEAAFVELYHKYLPLLTSIALKLSLNHSCVEDALQITWEDIAKDFRRMSSIPSHELPPYLATVMRNNCMDILRKEKKYTEPFFDENTALDDQTFDTVYAQEKYRNLVDLLRTMPTLYREVLERRLIMEQSNQEVAKALKISDNLAAKRYERGRAMLAEALRKDEASYG